MTSFRANWLWNGHQFETAEGLPLTDRGVRYGMALFETLRIRAGRPDFWRAHLCRLTEAAEICGFAVSEEALHAAAKIFPLANREGVARIYVTAGDGGPADIADQTRVAILFEERLRELPKSYFLVMDPEPHLPPFGGLKTANYWMNAEGLRRAHSKGANEALLFNHTKALIGASMGNVFIKTAAGWITPSRSSGARNGVVREWVCERLCAEEAIIERAQIDGCESMVVTSSWIGIMPVHRVAERALNPTCERILQLREEWEQLPPEKAP